MKRRINSLRPDLAMLERRLFLVLGVLLAAHATPTRLSGQVVTGQVIDSTSGMPVGTGFVVLIDTTGNEIDRALSTSDGRFMLQAPDSGTFRLRSERIGYRAHESGPLVLPADTTVYYTLRVVAFPVVLAAVEVRGEEQCRVNPERAAETALVWEEIRKALAATAWDGSQELAYFRKYTYERHLNGDLQGIGDETGSTVQGVASQPYQSLPAAQLAQDGYIVDGEDEASYALPDAEVLLDETFLATHCFRVVRDSVARPGQLGLAFEPARDRDIADVRGVLWLEEETSRLKTLEVTFTRLPGGVRDRYAGGEVEFLQLPSGAWIVQRWQLLTPNIYLRQATEQQVTIMVISRRGMGIVSIEAIYGGARRYRLGGSRGLRLGDSVAVNIPWFPDELTFRTPYGISREIFLRAGEVFVIKYPEYFRRGGLLHRDQ